MDLVEIRKRAKKGGKKTSKDGDPGRDGKEAQAPEDVPPKGRSKGGGGSGERRPVVPRRGPASLEEVFRSQREEEQEDEEETLQVLTFTLGNEEYGLDIMSLKEIIKPKEATEVPRTPPFVLGIISLRGVIIPIFDMRRRLGLEEADNTRASRIVVVKVMENLYGLLVDSVVQVMHIPLKNIEPPPEIIGGVDAEFLQGVGKVEDNFIILLNLEKVLSLEGEAEPAPIPGGKGGRSLPRGGRR